MAKWDDQLDKIKQVIKIMDENSLVEVQIKQGDDEISVKKGQQQHITAVPMMGAAMPTVSPGPAVSPPAPGAQPAEGVPQDNLAEIKSPLVGTFYSQASPDSDPYVEVGMPVEPDTVVCIIEAMKVMNEVKAEISGTITEMVATSGSAVEYGQVLYKIKPD